MSVIIDGTLGVTTAGAARMPAWATAGRPVSPVAGDTGFNTTLGKTETWSGTEWVPTGWILGTPASLTGLASLILTGIPSWANEIVIHEKAVSHATGNSIRIRLGNSTSIIALGYTASAGYNNLVGGTTGTGSTTHFPVTTNAPAVSQSGYLNLKRRVGNEWVIGGVVTDRSLGIIEAAGDVDVTDALTRIEFSVASGTFSSGQIYLSWRN